MANLTSKEWRDLIFEGKNKEFGAYDLRKKSEKRHTLAVIFTLIGLVIVILAVIGYSKFSDWREAQRQAELLLERERMSQIEMAEEEVPEEEEEEQKYEEPEKEEIKQVEEQPLATVQVTQIDIVDDDKVVNKVLDMQEQKEDNTARGIVNQQGSDDVDNAKEVKEQVTVAPPPPAPEVKAVAPPPEPEKPKPAEDKIFDAVEQPPMFPGGQEAMMKWLSNNIRYPEAAQQNNVSGRVIVSFVVEKDGSVSDVKLAKGIDRDLDNEALRVVKRMPKWQPGKNNGVAVRTKFTLPVTFKLQNQ